jgi:UDP-N-acetylmuramoyl-tripeptide--D-alanyl-D-alanine ligase
MVGRGHLEGVGSIEGVANAKSEIYEFAPRNATFIFNLDNEHTNRMMSQFAGEGRRTITFGEAAGDVSLHVKSMTSNALVVEGEIKNVSGSVSVPVFGKHNITNLMSAASLALAAGMSPQEIWQALPLCRSAWGRNQWVNLKSGARVLFDGYNANPESMRAALENSKLLLAPTAASEFRGRGIAVLGEMRELGDHAAALHEELGQILRHAGFSEVIFIGPSCEAVKKGFANGETSKIKSQFLPAFDAKAATTLKSELKSGDYVLIKGSRGMSLEVFLEALEPLDFKKK